MPGQGETLTMLVYMLHAPEIIITLHQNNDQPKKKKKKLKQKRDLI
jgi:hypothetical protein